MPELIKSELSLDLTHDESRDRLALERKVEQAFYIAGLSLAQLRDRRLYRSTHNSFEEYCQDRFGMKRRHPYRLIDAAKVVDNILEVCPNGTHKNGDTIQQLQIVPTSEWQARPLTKLSPAEQREVWSKAVELAGHKIPSGKIVSQVVSKIMCPNRTQIKYKIGQKIKIQSNHSLFGGSSGTIKQIPNHTEVIVKLDNGQTESISNEYIQLELDSSIDAPAYPKVYPLGRREASTLVNPLGQELPSPGIAYKVGIGLEYNVRLSQETWEKLNEYAVHEGTASLDGAISLTAWLRNARLLDSVSRS
ncbi:MAG: hypothetical protein HC930_01620 [Hydrococcus sp. SU_1_0]|nr:hypothetical protein [Hydrococcus sp. SU_1_0]NJO96201.1 hypothetical protein [Pleurocapsa sp. CRU_1_2]